ncbi:LuxR C-terminal-related transcriptional regulator [uncultured Bacteroides sp.]|uniref:LuxR C-terminal-related transcriptional regulator n=1 Tax=uncultured Bacteroides sp. TaxID=162156 RepID=UPI002AABAD40|nr:LuxR C-terminal-related transcriptional regulator [uncultured Bacteroides sp.]
MNIDAKLSEREIEIAEIIAFGKKQKEAADILHISKKTVDNTVQHIYKKIGISFVTELSVFCFCRKFGIPLSMCEPARRAVSVALLLLFLYGEFNHTPDIYRVRRGRNRETEVFVRSRNRTET